MADTAVRGATITEKKPRKKAVRTVLSGAEKDKVLAEKVRLGRLLSDNNLPDSVRGEASRLLSMGNVQLAKRLRKSGY